MRVPLTLVTILTVIFASSYWLSNVSANCVAPLAYRIGDIDAQFDLTRDQARIALMDAEAVWENATGRNLFSYDDDAAFTVNFIYDERHALTKAERDLRQRLDESRDINDTIDATYNDLVAEYETQVRTYQQAVTVFEERLQEYNDEVASYNESGGAPQPVYDRLKEERVALDARKSALDARARELDALVSRINNISEEGNRLVEIHNQHVAVYNDTFSESREFTQGDYTGNAINIYTFANRDELILVLAHELGHALGIGHVENEQSLMYHHMGAQPQPLTLTEEDEAAFRARCGIRDGYSHFDSWMKTFANWLSGLSGV